MYKGSSKWKKREFIIVKFNKAIVQIFSGKQNDNEFKEI